MSIVYWKKCGKFFISCENQFGFKKGTGCSNAVYFVRQSIERYTNNGSTVNTCALDLSKAFDTVNQYGLYIKLMIRNIPVQLLDIVIGLCSQCYSSISSGIMFSRVHLNYNSGSDKALSYLPCCLPFTLMTLQR